MHFRGTLCPALDGAPPTTTARMAARLTPITVAAVPLQGAGVNFFSLLFSEMDLIVIHEEEKLVMGICCFMEIYIYFFVLMLLLYF